MIDIFAGDGAHWSPMTRTPTDIADALEGLTEAERLKLGFSDWHHRKGLKREAQNAKIKRVCQSSLNDALALAELDGDRARPSRLRMTLSAVQMIEVADGIVDLIADHTRAD